MKKFITKTNKLLLSILFFFFTLSIASRIEGNHFDIELIVLVVGLLVVNLIAITGITFSVVKKERYETSFHIISGFSMLLLIYISTTFFRRHFEVPNDSARLFLAIFLAASGIGGLIFHIFKTLEICDHSSQI